MDGGHLGFDPQGNLTTVWRREKAIIAAGESGEKLLSSQGLHPVLAIGSGGVQFIWQSGPRLMSKKGSAEPVLFAEQGSFPAIDAGSPLSSPIVVWESSTNGLKTILARKLE